MLSTRRPWPGSAITIKTCRFPPSQPRQLISNINSNWRTNLESEELDILEDQDFIDEIDFADDEDLLADDLPDEVPPPPPPTGFDAKNFLQLAQQKNFYQLDTELGVLDPAITFPER